MVGGGLRYEMGMGEIKKGPWKPEEDEVLIIHVNKYGPRDWSSIRSKGLLHRTGKSCRLRWVNKLRPNLKNGVKFLAEEERTVIELQGEFGNKWARIATYFPGRTDNDVKNFWSSRQKRLARILQTPPAPPKSQKNHRESPVLTDVPSLEAPKFSSSTDEESSTKPKSCTSSYMDHNPKPIKMVPLPELMLSPNLCHFEQNLFQLEFTAIENDQPSQNHQPQLQYAPHSGTEVPLTIESQDLMSRLGEPNFFDVFGNSAAGSEIGNLPLQYAPHFGTGTSCGSIGRGQNDNNPVTPDSFIDDFPMDMFDHIESLPSPSDW